MRRTLILCAISLAAWAGSLQPGRAGPFCMDISRGGPDCSFRTWAQCRASLPGVGIYCYTNDLAGYVFDKSDPANPRVIIPVPPRKARMRR